MTRLMEQVIEKLRSLPEDKQDTVAGFVLSELESDRMWDETSIKHKDALRKLAGEAVSNLGAGQTSQLNSDNL